MLNKCTNKTKMKRNRKRSRLEKEENVKALRFIFIPSQTDYRQLKVVEF